MFLAGQQIGGYTLIEKLGRGGFGEVWLAEKRSHFVTKKVAVKLPHEEQVNFDAIRQEATLWEQASGHPNVLPIIDADIYDNQVVIVSEYADGGSLHDKLNKKDTLPLKLAVEMTVGILNGLEYLHSKEIIHRDIKPQNILLQGNTPRLADFGISRVMNTTMVSSAVIGTDAYMSPEAFDGKRNVQTDIWSVGVVLYQLLKGSLPFPQEHPSERMFAVLTKEFEPLDDTIPSDLKEIVQNALAKRPEQRYQTTTEMRDELQKALVGIAHPTLAKTEVLRIPVLPDPPVAAPTVLAYEQNVQADAEPTIAQNHAAGETEIKTIVRDTPYSVSPGQQSVVTQLKALQEDKPAADFQRLTNLFTYIGVSVLGLFLLIGAIAAILGSRSGSGGGQANSSNSSNSNTSNTSNTYPYLSPYKDNSNKYGYWDGYSVAIEPKYEEAYPFREGLGAVKLNGKWGYINDKGVEVIPIKYETASGYFSEGLAAVSLDKKHGFIDKTGTIVITLMYESAGSMIEGLASVKLNGKYGYIDKSGKEIIPFRFGDVSSFSNGLAIACLDGYFKDSCGVIDKTGREVAPLKYDNISSFAGGMADVQIDNKHGFIDKTGKEVIPLKYDSMGGFYDDKNAEVTLNGRKIRIDKYGNETDLGPVNTPVDANWASNASSSNTASNTLASNRRSLAY